MADETKKLRVEIEAEATGSGPEETIGDIQRIGDAADRTSDQLEQASQVEIDPSVDTSDLEDAANAAEDAKEKVEDIGAAEPEISVDASQVEAAEAKVQELGDAVDAVDGKSIHIEADVDDVQAAGETAKDAAIDFETAAARANDAGTLVSGLNDLPNLLKMLAKGLKMVGGPAAGAAKGIAGVGMALRILFKTIGSAGPVAVLATAVTGLAFGLYKLLNPTKDVTTAMDRANESAARMAAETKATTDAIRAQTTASQSSADQLQSIGSASAEAQKHLGELAKAQRDFASAQIDAEEASGRITSQEADRRRALMESKRATEELSRSVESANKAVEDAEIVALNRSSQSQAARAAADKAVRDAAAYEATLKEVFSQFSVNDSFDSEAAKAWAAEAEKSWSRDDRNQATALTKAVAQLEAQKEIAKARNDAAWAAEIEARAAASLVAPAKEALADAKALAAERQKVIDIEAGVVVAQTTQAENQAQLEKELLALREENRVKIQEMEAAGMSLSYIQETQRQQLTDEHALRQQIAVLQGKGNEEAETSAREMRSLLASQAEEQKRLEESGKKSAESSATRLANEKAITAEVAKQVDISSIRPGDKIDERRRRGLTTSDTHERNIPLGQSALDDWRNRQPGMPGYTPPGSMQGNNPIAQGAPMATPPTAPAPISPASAPATPQGQQPGQGQGPGVTQAAEALQASADQIAQAMQAVIAAATKLSESTDTSGVVSAIDSLGTSITSRFAELDKKIAALASRI